MFMPSVLLLSHCTGILKCQVLDVGVAAFLLDPDDLPSSYPHLLARFSIPVPGKVCKEKYMQLLISLDKQIIHSWSRKWWAAVQCEEDHS